MSSANIAEQNFDSEMRNRLLPGDFLRILIVGDVVGRPGRSILKQTLPLIRNSVPLDFVIINGENVAGGFGITEKVFAEMIKLGVNALTLGNHWNDKPDVFRIKGVDARLVFPHNLQNVSDVERIPEFEIPNRGFSISVVNLLGNFAMKGAYGCPFRFLQKEKPSLESKVQSGRHVVVVDFHAEASSEKQAAAWFLNGIAAAVVGTHTHVPTSDERVSAAGTAFVTDLGMTGPYDSIIGMDIQRTMKRYLYPGEKGPHEVARHNLWFCGVLIEVSTKTCLTEAMHRLQFRSSTGAWTISTVRAPR